MPSSCLEMKPLPSRSKTLKASRISVGGAEQVGTSPLSPAPPSLGPQDPQSRSPSPALRIHYGDQWQVAQVPTTVLPSGSSGPAKLGSKGMPRPAVLPRSPLGGSSPSARRQQPLRVCSRRPRVAGKHGSRGLAAVASASCQRLPCPPLTPSIPHSPSSPSHASSPGLAWKLQPSLLKGNGAPREAATSSGSGLMGLRGRRLHAETASPAQGLGESGGWLEGTQKAQACSDVENVPCIVQKGSWRPEDLGDSGVESNALGWEQGVT